LTLALLVMLAAVPSSPCAILGEDVSTRTAVDVRVDDGTGFKAHLRDVPLRATFEGQLAHVTLDRPVALAAPSCVDRPPRSAFRWRRRALARRCNGRKTSGDTIAGDVLLEADDDELETEDKPPQLWFPGRVIRDRRGDGQLA